MRLLAVHRWRHRKGGAEGVHLDHLALFRERGWDCADFAVDHPDNEPSEWSDYFPAPFAPRAGVARTRVAAALLPFARGGRKIRAAASTTSAPT